MEEDKDLEQLGEDQKPAVPAEGLDAVREGLQEAIDKLQDVADRLRDIER